MSVKEVKVTTEAMGYTPIKKVYFPNIERSFHTKATAGPGKRYYKFIAGRVIGGVLHWVRVTLDGEVFWWSISGDYVVTWDGPPSLEVGRNDDP